MKTKQEKKPVDEVSSIIETYDNDGIGLLGFTVKYTNGSFENCMKEFNMHNKEEVLHEMKLLRQTKLRRK